MTEPARGAADRSTCSTRVAAAIAARRGADPATSYVASLFAKGEDAILKKIGEEATETVMAAKDGDKLRIAAEVADLWFHCLVLLARHGLGPADVRGRARAARRRLGHRREGGAREVGPREARVRGGRRRTGCPAGPEDEGTR